MVDYLFGGNGNLDLMTFQKWERLGTKRGRVHLVGHRVAFPKLAGPNPSTSRLWWLQALQVVVKICTVRLFGVDAADRKWHSLACSSDVAHHASRTAYGDNMFFIFDAVTSLTDF